MLFKNIRILLLLLIMLVVVWDQSISTMIMSQWKKPIDVHLLVVNASQSEASQNYIYQLTAAEFNPVNEFMRSEMERYGMGHHQQAAFQFDRPRIGRSKPPMLPQQRGVLNAISWSLKMRYWMWMNDGFRPFSNSIRVVLIYHDPVTNTVLEHSTGVERGKFAVVNVFASAKQAEQNQVVLLHELLHTLGASDKYNTHTNQPLAPEGLGDPKSTPLYPQSFAEIMAGRIALTAHKSRIPHSLDETLIGERSAREIGFKF